MEKVETKICKICGEVKSLTEFYTQKRIDKKTGEQWIYYNPECKKCTKKRSTKWFDEHPEKHKEKYRKQSINRKEYLKEYRKDNREQLSKSLNEWQNNNKEKVNGYNENRKKNKNHKITSNEWESCKNYFNYCCCYCGLKIEDHIVKFKGEWIHSDFHKEHADDDGLNDLSNCIPSCKNCNSQKNTFKLEEWYNETNDIFTYERLNKILKWLQDDYKKYIKHKIK